MPEKRHEGLLYLGFGGLQGCFCDLQVRIRVPPPLRLQRWLRNLQLHQQTV